MNPCRDCDDSNNGDKCRTHEFCTKLIEWQVEMAWRVDHERHADPQEERGMVYHIDDREV